MSSSLPEAAFAPYEVVRALAGRPNPAYVVRQGAAGAAGGGKVLLLVAERFAGAGRAQDPQAAEFVREAKRIATVASPSIVRVRELAARGEDVIVFSELADGEKLDGPWGTDKLPLEVALRVLIDVLSGAGLLHNLRDTKQQPMKLAHGELSPRTLVLGLDGTTRVLHAVARRAPGAQPDPGSLGTMAPEVLAGEPYDQRADVFSVGVLLWEALSAKRLFPEGDAAVIAARARAGGLPAAGVPEKTPWAKPLVEVAARAIAASPADRWPTAAALATELRKAAGLKLAPASTAAVFAKNTFGERVKARRQQLETQPAGALPEAPVAKEAAAPATQDAAPAPAAQEVDVPISIAPPAPSPAPAPPAPAPAQKPRVPPSPGFGFVLDPAAAAAKLAKPAPPPAPPAPAAPAVKAPSPAPPVVAVPSVVQTIRPPPVDAPVPSPRIIDPAPEPAIDEAPVSGLPQYASALAAPGESQPPPPAEMPAPSPPPPPAAASAPSPSPSRPPAATAPSLVRQAEEAERAERVAYRRRVALVGGVVGLGAIVVLAALVKRAHHEPEAAEPPATAAAIATVAGPAASSAIPAPPAPPPAEPPATAAPAPPPPPPPPPPTPAAPPPPPAHQAVAAAPPGPKPAVRHAPAPRPKKKPKPQFDPNTL